MLRRRDLLKLGMVGGSSALVATNLMRREVNIHNHGHKVPVESDGGPLDVIRPGESRTRARQPGEELY